MTMAEPIPEAKQKRIDRITEHTKVENTMEKQCRAEGLASLTQV